MKTIIVHFVGATKKYCYRINDDTIKVGDRLHSRSYDHDIIVDNVLSSEFNFVNSETGDLTVECTSVYCKPIKTIVLKYEDDDVIYAHKVLVK